jgi:phosphoribosylaminoimidazolecarboxamide formyltransferase/IMP cyclohydrolase
LVQDIDTFDSTGDLSGNWKLVSGSAADKSTLADLEFAWRSVRAVKSNAIVLAKDLTTVGIGMGQVNRVDSVQLAVQRARLRSQGSVAASDAFFPFKDGVLALIDAGVKAIVHPGGSIRDQEVIEAAESAGVTMYTTGVRHFWH